MERLYILRHMESIGNKLRFIQSNNFDLGITHQSKMNISAFVNENALRLKQCKQIICSPAKRTLETAMAFHDELKIPIDVNRLLVEVNAGVLSGLNHELVEEIYPTYYDVWLKRGDLDSIYKAESGLRLQARVLMFLYQINDLFDNAIVVTHAAFIRCLINTYNNRSREAYVDIGHSVLHECIEPWESIKKTVIKITKSKQVLCVNTKDNKYLLKENLYDYKKNYKALVNIQQALHMKLNCCPEIYGASIFLRENELKILKIESFLEGVHKDYNEIEDENLIVLINTIYSCNKTIDVKNINYTIISLDSYIRNLIKQCMSKSYLFEYKNVLTYWNNSQIFMNENCVVFMDVHKQNILFNGTTVKLLDFDNALRACDEFQIGCVLACYCLMGQQVDNYKKIISKIIELWPNKQINLRKVLTSVVVRAVIGIIHFETKIHNGTITEHDKTILKNYKRIYKEVKDVDNYFDKLYHQTHRVSG